MTKYKFEVFKDEKGWICTTVTRLSDKAVKRYSQVHGTVEGMTLFMNSITDELAESYFPRPRKKK